MVAKAIPVIYRLRRYKRSASIYILCQRTPRGATPQARKGNILERAPYQKDGVMVIIMAKKTLEEMFSETKYVSAEVGRRVNAHTDKKTSEVQETVARAGKRINDHTTAEHAATRKHSDDNHAATRQRSDDNHAETREVVRSEAAATRKALRDYMEWPEIIFGLILGIIAGVALWLMEKDVIVKPTAMDAAGNVTAYGTDVFMVAILAAVFGIFVFFVVSWIVHAIRGRNR